MTYWWNDYIGVPYTPKGRTRAGADCWGLVRLVYAHEFGITLPDLSDGYATDDSDTIKAAIESQRDRWRQIEKPEPGCVAVFRVDGHFWHVGIVTADNRFLHVRRDGNAVTERLDSPLWACRLEGFYRYAGKEESGAVIAARPHPLVTNRLDGVVPPGMTLAEIDLWMRAKAGLSPEFQSHAVITVDSIAVPQCRWVEVVPAPGQRVEYRAVADGSGLRSIASLAIMIGATALAPGLAPALTPLFGSAATAVATAALSFAGTALLNAIAPVKPAKVDAGDAGKTQAMLQGGSNQFTPYGAIPVVLGKMRFTAPTGAETYVESDGDTSYLRMLLVWGYGPLAVSDFRLGDTPLELLDEVEHEFLDGSDTATEIARFDAIYGRDVSQAAPDNLLEFKQRGINSGGMTRVGSTVTVTTTEAHGYQVGHQVSFENPAVTLYEITATPTSTTFQFTSASVLLTHLNCYAGPWYEVTVPGAASRINATFHFPRGLFGADETDGTISAIKFSARIQYRQLDSDTLLPVGAGTWSDVTKTVGAQSFSLPTAYYDTGTDGVADAVFRWTIVSLDATNKIILRHGAYTANVNLDPSGQLLTNLQRTATGSEQVFTRLPDVPADELVLYHIWIYGAGTDTTGDNKTQAVFDKRGESPFTVTGCNLTQTDGTRNFTVTAGTLAKSGSDTIAIGGTGQSYSKMKDAFTLNASWTVPKGRWQVRVLRTSYDGNLSSPGTVNAEAHLITVTGYDNAKPITFPKPLAKSAIRIKATNQLNGTAQGIIATAISICKDWDATTSTWVERATRNPASLFRWVLQHPGNARAKSDSEIDLVGLQAFHVWCALKGFCFDAVITDQRSLKDVLRAICAAGRASPAWRNGKWTVIIDKEQTVIAQHFTPHNSWGFKSTRSLEKLPHGLRVRFQNAAKGFQDDERIVYRDGYSAANATTIQGLDLEGVTQSDAVWKLGRFALAQMQARRERYQISVDREAYICERGDLIKVNHDVPLWGLGSGRIAEFISTTSIRLSDSVTMTEGLQYTIRIRTETGTSVLRTVAAKPATGVYDTITLTATITSTEGKAGNLYMFGALAEESVDGLVTEIEAQDDSNAIIHFLDYASGVYSADTGTIPAHDPNITLPPRLQKPITQKPTLSQFISDESVMTKINATTWGFRIRVSFTHPAGISQSAEYVQVQFRDSDITGSVWPNPVNVPVNSASAFLPGVLEGETYSIRARYVSSGGKVGPWTTPVSHTVTGRLNRPKTPTTFAVSITGNDFRLTWAKNAEIDIAGYEVRNSDANWGTATGLLWKGNALALAAIPAAAGTSKTWYIKAYDVLNLYSTAAASVSYTVTAPSAPSAPTQKNAKTATGLLNVTADWADATAGSFPVAGYEIRTANSGWGTAGFAYKGATSAATLANISATTPTTFYIKSFDTRGNYSVAATSFTTDVQVPGNLDTATLTVKRVAATLNFTLGALPTPPADFDAYEIRGWQVRAGATTGNDTPDATTSGATGDTLWNDPDFRFVTTKTTTAAMAITSFPSPQYAGTGVTYKFQVRQRDKAGNYSAVGKEASIVVKALT